MKFRFSASSFMFSLISVVCSHSVFAYSYTNDNIPVGKAPLINELPVAPEMATKTDRISSIENHDLKQGGICVTANPLASDACRKALEQGGSAADGAIAAAWVLGLVEPQSSGLGGGGYVLYFDNKKQGKVTALDGRETAPMSATPDRFLNASGQPMPFFDAVKSGLSVGTPSMVALMSKLHQHQGKLPWSATFQAAIEHAEKGFLVSPRLHKLIVNNKQLPTSSAKTYFFPNRHPLMEGQILKNEAYANTLQQIANDPQWFYRSQLSQKIVTAVQKAGGDLSREDLARYQVKVKPALCKTISLNKTKNQVCGMPPSSSGGIAVLQTLGQLATDSVKNEVQRVTELTNSQALGFADRNAYVADDAYADIPTAQLLDDNYLAKRGKLAQQEKALASKQVQAGLGEFPSQAGTDAPNTTHISVIDKDGNAVSMTLSIENAFGSKIWVKEGGFLLNNELTDFSFLPEKEGKLIANRVQAGKRPRSSMSPTLVLDAKRTQVKGVLGSPGGSRIIGFVSGAYVDLARGLSPKQVIERGHVLRRGTKTEVEAGKFDAAFISQLKAAGHDVIEKPMASGLAIIWQHADGSYSAAADLRREGRVAVEK